VPHMLGVSRPEVHALDDLGGSMIRWEAVARWRRTARLSDPSEGSALSAEAASLLASWLAEAGPSVSLTLQLGAAPCASPDSSGGSTGLEIGLHLATLALTPQAAIDTLREAVADLAAALSLGGAHGPWEAAPDLPVVGRGTRVLMRDAEQPLPEAPPHGGFLTAPDRLSDMIRLLTMRPGPMISLTLRARPPITGLGSAVSGIDRATADPRQRGLHELPERSWRVVEQARMWSSPALDAQVVLLAGQRCPSPLMRAVVREAMGSPAPQLLTWRAAPEQRLRQLAAGGHRAMAAAPVDDDLPGPWRGDAAAGLLGTVALRDGSTRQDGSTDGHAPQTGP
jgi:hypothetical protein